MSSYLTFYLVPNKTKTKYIKDEEITIELPQEPLALFSYSRSSNIYQKYWESLNPAYAGDEDKYTELTPDMARRVVRDFEEEELIPAKNRLETLYKIIKESYNDDLANDIISSESYIRELENTLSELKWLANVIVEINYSCGDFQKVLINID